MIQDLNEKICYPRQHDHEVVGSTRNAGCCAYAHNHRFSTVTGNAIPCDGSHVHEVKFVTDSCNGHHHEFCGMSSPAVDVGCGRHIHYVEACTSTDADHDHEFVVASLIEDPTCEK